MGLDEADPRTHFKVDVQDWWRSEDGRQSFYAPAGSISRSCGHWVSANPMEATVAGGEALNIRLTVSVPQDVQPGGYWCALSVDEMPDPLKGVLQSAWGGRHLPIQVGGPRLSFRSFCPCKGGA